MKATITGLGHFVPEKRLTNADLEKMVDTSDEWITTRTGIKERRILDKDKGMSFMAVKAARNALDHAGLTAGEIDLIVLATVTPDMPVPNAAAFVQRELNADKCWGFDVNGGCAGFVYALSVGAQFIESGRHQKVLVIGSDKMSAIVDYDDRNTCVLFGDGAGAVVLEPSPDPSLGIYDFKLRLDGSGQPYLCMEGGGSLHPATRKTVDKGMHYVYQDGKNVFKNAINGMTDISLEVLKKWISPEELKLLVPHQANFRIIDSVAKKLNLKPEQVFVNINKYGNTTAATIPMALSEACRENRITREDWVLITAFGAGFAWGSLLMKWSLK